MTDSFISAIRLDVEELIQTRHADRLMLCRRMPLLDPRTLQPYPDANIGDTFDAPTFVRALEGVEGWHAQPYDDLIAHLRSRPRTPVIRVANDRARNNGSEYLFVRTQRGALEPSEDCRRQIENGLLGSSSRAAPDSAGPRGMTGGIPARRCGRSVGFSSGGFLTGESHVRRGDVPQRESGENRFPTCRWTPGVLTLHPSPGDRVRIPGECCSDPT